MAGQPTQTGPTSNQKMARDFTVATPAAAVGLVLAHFGLTSNEIAVVTPYLIPILMRVYRRLRGMQNGLGEVLRTVDPPSAADPATPAP